MEGNDRCDNHLQNSSQFFVEFVADVGIAFLLVVRGLRLASRRTQTHLRDGSGNDVDGRGIGAHGHLPRCTGLTCRHDVRLISRHLALDHSTLLVQNLCCAEHGC